MKKTIINILSILSILSVGISLSAQEQNLLRLFAKQSSEGMRLKVLPQNASIWLEGVEYGYNYYRKEAGAATFQKLNQEPIRPLEHEGFEAFEQGDSLKAFNQRAVFNSLAESKAERSPGNVYRYVQKRDQEFAFYILVSTRLRDISMISGMEFIDHTAAPDQEYIYKVELAKQDGYTCQLYHHPQTYADALPLLEAVSGEKSIQLAWVHQDEGNLVCYHLERAEDGQHFQRLNEAPIYPVESMQEDFSNLVYKQDSVPQNYQAYAYRLVGLDVWGDEVRSELLQYFMAVDKTAPQVPEHIETTVNEESKSITLKWKNQLTDDDFKACMVYYANERNGTYKQVSEPITNPEVQSFTLDSLSEFDRHYFKLVYTDTNLNFSTSPIVFAEVPDVYPPATPTGLSANAMPDGNVALTWNANTEKDLRGYMVFRSTNGKTNFLTLTPMHAAHNQWIDTTIPGGLNKNVFYFVRALDRMYNYSDNSDTLKVNLPDTLAPVAAYIQKVESNKEGIALSWIPSTSSDFQQQGLLVQQDGQKQDTLKLEKSQRNFTYNTQKPGTYHFQVLSLDDAGNTSLSNEKTWTIQNPATKTGFTRFKAKNKDMNTRLEWAFEGSEANLYLVYRKQKGSPLELIASTREQAYSDQNVRKGATYTYYIKAKDNKGSFIAESKTQKVKF